MGTEMVEGKSYPQAKHMDEDKYGLYFLYPYSFPCHSHISWLLPNQQLLKKCFYPPVSQIILKLDHKNHHSLPISYFNS